MDDARVEYADIIGRGHPVSTKHPPMSQLNRAAQFAPFAALTGYDDLIRESERETDARTELDESSIEELNRKLVWLLRQDDPPEASFTFFVPDIKKAGGAYETVTGKLLRYDQFSRSITLDSEETLFIDDILAIESDAFCEELLFI